MVSSPTPIRAIAREFLGSGEHPARVPGRGRGSRDAVRPVEDHGAGPVTGEVRGAQAFLEPKAAIADPHRRTVRGLGAPFGRPEGFHRCRATPKNPFTRA